MCGIFGVAYRDTTRVPEEELLRASVRALAHRGPDASGIHADVGVGLCHTRLSLLDLSERGRQPFWDPDRRYCLVYNGEIYNFKELRAELELEGVHFQTETDTEVLLHGLIRWDSKKILRRLEGMFAFCLFDTRDRSLLLARDRHGIKPLALYESDEAFLFASEIKAMKPWVTLEANPFSISSTLLGFGGPTQGQCFFRGVTLVPPGSMVRVAAGKQAELEPFVTVPDLIDLEEEEKLARMKPHAVVDHLDELLQHAVKQMLFADAPVGALCSGGVDSSLIMAMAARCHDNLAIFHADVVGPESEYPAALELSKHLGLDLLKVDVHDQDFIDGIAEVAYHYDHPFMYHPNSVPFLAVTKLVRQHGVKAVLSGEGSDECFLGYQCLTQEPVIRAYERQVARLKSLIQHIPFAGKFLWPEVGTTQTLVSSMLNGFEREMEVEYLDREYARRRGAAVDWNVRTLHWLSYHLRTTLHRNDCLGMAASIEARFPMLDERITKMAVNLPHRFKIRFSPGTLEKAHPFFRDKWVMRMVADRYMPKGLSRRKKMGFPATAFERMTIPRDYFGSSSFVPSFFGLTSGQTDYLFENGNQDLKAKLLLLDVWSQVCLEDRSPEEASEHIRRHIHFA